MSSSVEGRQVVVSKYGGPEVLEVRSVEVAQPGPGEVLVRQEAMGLNFIDIYHRSGLYPLPRLPHAIGMEAAGTVEAVGEGVDGVRDVAVGDRVAYATAGPGAYATMRAVPTSQLVKLPRGVSCETAAAMLLKGLTVQYLVRRTFAVQPGQWVLLHAAAGGVGLLACQWLAHLGAKVIGTVGSEEKAERAKWAGCRHTLLYRRENVRERVRELTGGRGVQVVYDSVGQDTFEASLDCLAPRGVMVSFGNASGPPPPLDVLSLSRRGSLFVTRPTLAHYVSTAKELSDAAGELFALLEQGVLKAPVAQRFSMHEVAEAHRALEARKTIGSTVLLP